jgi:subtilisin-like proprotein convertase family protein
LNKRLWLGLATIFLVSCNSGSLLTEDLRKPSNVSGNDDIAAKVIYGEDNRKDYYQVSSQMQNLADSTVALVRKNKLEEVPGVGFNFSLSNFGQEMRLCSSEPFYEQDTLAFCSGSLVGEDLILTAGHCIRSNYDCSRTAFVFGFAYKEEGQQPRMAGLDDVYTCAEILHTEVTGNGSDYAVIRVDRKVVGRSPLSVARNSKAQAGDDLVVIGHPSGLPTKVADGASVRKDSGTFFVANLDTYGGNSGSAVFDASTNKIVGVLVRGETDFVSRGSCTVSNRCADNSCRGEDVTHVERALAFIPEIEEPNPDVPADTGGVYQVNLMSEIPDNSREGVVSSVMVPAPKGKKVKIGVDIEHTWRGDLVVVLSSPDGRDYVLHRRSGGSQDNLVGVYGESLESASSIDALANVDVDGLWTLKVTDNASRDVGVLRAWAVIVE